MKTGTVKFFQKEKGYGFIINDEDQSEIFVHASGVIPNYDIEQGHKVKYSIKEGKKGLNAVEVTPVD